MIRDLVLTLTIVAFVFLAAHQPGPSRLVQTDYCIVTRKAAAKDPSGQWHTFWAEGYGPCSEQDIYRNI